MDTQQIRFISRESGTWVYLPLYTIDDYILDIKAELVNSKRRKREIELSVDKFTLLELELLATSGSDYYSDPVIGLNKGYLFSHFSAADFQATFKIHKSSEFKDKDLAKDVHIGKIVKEKAKSIVSEGNSAYENAQQIYDYVFSIPFTGEKFVGKFSGKPRTPTHVVRSHRAKKCLCKAELFKDLCIASGIPARTLHAEYFSEEDIKKYQNSERIPNKNHSHAIGAFYYNGWCLADPTLGGLDHSFRAQNYYDKIITANGIETLQVSIRENK
jgi:transglutaminase-like putative cysteine protease